MGFLHPCTCLSVLCMTARVLACVCVHLRVKKLTITQAPTKTTNMATNSGRCLQFFLECMRYSLKYGNQACMFRIPATTQSHVLENELKKKVMLKEKKFCKKKK